MINSLAKKLVNEGRLDELEIVNCSHIKQGSTEVLSIKKENLHLHNSYICDDLSDVEEFEELTKDKE